jgi:HTH-type transcriptional regulator / antitoxin HigA
MAEAGGLAAYGTRIVGIWALKEIEAYFKNVPVPGTEAADRFDALSALVEKFEDANFPVPRTS